MRRGFQTVQRRVPSSAERGATSETSERLDVLGTAMRAISDEGVDVRIGDSAVRTLWVGTGEALSGYADGVLPVGFLPRTRDVTSAEAGLTLGEGVQARRQEGQSSGVRGDAADGVPW
jgi:hypothetical protein